MQVQMRDASADVRCKLEINIIVLSTKKREK